MTQAISWCFICFTSERADDIYRQGQLKLDRSLGGGGGSIRFHFELISSSLRLHFDFTSDSLRFHFDFTLISIRLHFDFTSDSLRFHIDFTSSSLRFHFHFTLISIRLHFDLFSDSLQFHFEFTSIVLRSHFDFTWGKGKTPCHTREKGKLGVTKGKREKTPVRFELEFHLATRPRARTNETKRFPGRSHPPTSDIYTRFAYGALRRL